MKLMPGTVTPLTLAFYTGEGETRTPVTLPTFFFTVWDIDQGESDAKEKLYIEDFDGYYLNRGHNLTVGFDYATGRSTFLSNVAGTAFDNPVDPMDITQKQRGQAVTFKFANTSSVKLTYEITGTALASSAGRHFVFSGKTDFACMGKIHKESYAKITRKTTSNCTWEARASGKWKYMLKLANTSLWLVANGSSPHANITLEGNREYGMVAANGGGFTLEPHGAHYRLKMGETDMRVALNGGAHDGSNLVLEGTEGEAGSSDFDLEEAGGGYLLKLAGEELYLGVSAESPGENGSIVTLHGDKDYAKKHWTSQFDVVQLDVDAGSAAYCGGPMMPSEIVFTTTTTTTTTDEFPCRDNDGAQPGEALIDFELSELVHANLGGFGPDSGDANMRFANIVTYNGKQVDLLVRSSPSFSPKNYLNNGKRGEFGQINLIAGSKTEISFNFVDNKTDEPVTFQTFFFSFFDLDLEGTGTNIKRERVTADGFEKYFITPTSQVDVQKDGSKIAFTSTKSGTAADNPLFTDKMTKLQADRGVTFQYKEKSSFTTTLQVTGGGEAGRNFQIAGKSAIASCGSAYLPSMELAHR